MSVDLIVVGTGGAASSVLEIAALAGRHVRWVVPEGDAPPPQDSKLGRPVAASLACIADHLDAEVVLGVGDNARRSDLASELRSRYPSIRFATLISPMAHVSAHASVREGAIVGYRSYVGPDVQVGAHALVLSGVLGHDNVLGNCASMAPGSTLAGGARVGQRTMIGMHTAVRERVRIGDDVLVGAASYVDRDLDDAVVAFGNPARVRRRRQPSDPFFVT